MKVVVERQSNIRRGRIVSTRNRNVKTNSRNISTVDDPVVYSGPIPPTVTANGSRSVFINNRAVIRTTSHDADGTIRLEGVSNIFVA